jgi:GNAT superfamily N-acetyltransferase
VAEIGGRLVGAAFGSLHREPPAKGYVDLLAVAPTQRRHGVAGRMLDELERRLVEGGAAELVVGLNTPCYAWPGVDVRYTAAVSCLEGRGYARGPEHVGMSIDLDGLHLDTDAAERSLAGEGISIRRMKAKEEAGVRSWIAASWGESWAWEAGRAFEGEPIRGHLALRGDRIVGFAVHGVHRPAGLGPLGTVEAERGRGVGTVLMRRCLRDQRAADLDTSNMFDAGPVAFYAREVGAVIDRIFWEHRRPVSGGADQPR